MIRSYDFNKQDKLTQKWQEKVISFLRNKKETQKVVDVSLDTKYQNQGIDLLWEYKNKREEVKELKIEIKADDRMAETGNFFFETVSNDVKKTPGCFLISKADYFFYISIKENVLYILPLTKTREWFMSVKDNYPEKATSTPDISGKILYRTLGVPIPKDVVLKNVSGIKIIKNFKPK